MPLSNPSGLIGLVGLLPILAVYLLRQRSRRVEVPSLVLFREMEASRRYQSFLRRLWRDRRLFLQLLAVALAALAMAGPYVVTGADVKTAVIVDGSGSMQGVYEEVPGALDGYVDGSVSVYAAGPSPIELADNVTPGEAGSRVESYRPGDVRANLAGAMQLAADRGADRVVVVSDFLGWAGTDPGVVAERLESGGVDVALVQVGEPTPNVGIVDGDLSIGEGKASFRVSRFGGSAGEVGYTVYANGEVFDRGSVEVVPDGGETVSLSGLPPGRIRVTVDGPDPAFDDSAYFLLPSTSRRVLVVGEEGSEAGALRAAGAEVEVGGSVSGGYDLVVLKDSEGVTGSGIDSLLSSGGTLVIHPSVDPSELPAGTRPVEVSGTVEGSAGVEPLRTWLTEGAALDSVTLRRFVEADAVEGATVHARTSGGNPLVVSRRSGGGRVVFTGFSGEEEWSDFSFRRGYPVFWVNLLHGPGGETQVSTGDILATGGGRVETPSGVRTGARIFVDESGFYRWEGGEAAANLFSPAESDTTERRMDPANYELSGEPVGDSGEIRRDLTPVALLLLAAAILYEARLRRLGA